MISGLIIKLPNGETATIVTVNGEFIDDVTFHPIYDA